MDISNIKLAFFDFDETLAKHRDPAYVERRGETGENEFFKQAYLRPEIFYDEIAVCTAPDEMLELTKRLRASGAAMYCLSAMRMSLHMKAKESFVHKHYGNDIKMLVSATQERKVDVVSILQEVHGCRKDEVLFVDDLELVVNLMNENGFKGCLVEDVKSLLV